MKTALFVMLAACSSEDNLGNHVFGDARWSVALGSTGEDRATAIAVDAQGNVIVAGTCDGVIGFGASGATAACNGSFITERARDDGRELWTAILRGTEVSSVGIDGAGNVVVTGSYTASANVAGVPLSTTGTDQLIAIFDPDGGVHRVAQLGMLGMAVSPVGTVEDDGCVYVTGGFWGTMPTAGGSVTNDSDDLDAYFAAHDPDGSLAWGALFGGDGMQRGKALAASDDGHVAVLVESSAPIAMVDAPSWPATFVARYTNEGALEWTRAQPTADLAHIAITPGNDIVLGGSDGDCPVVRVLDEGGRPRWTTTCTKRATVEALAVAPDGTILAGGHNLASGVGELFLAAYSAEGASIGLAESPLYPYPADSHLAGIAVEPSGEVAYIASVNHPFDFGNGMLPFAGGHDVVIVKLESPTGHDGPVVLF